MDKMDFLKKIKPNDIINSSIGRLAIFDITVSEKIKIEDELNNNLQDSNGKEYVSTLAKYACHKEDVLEKSQSKPPERTLTDEDIKSLNDNDLELISKIYIENNEYLYKESIQETKKGEDGINVTSTKYGNVILPKKDTENYQEYLLRIEIEYNKKVSESIKKSFGNLTSFSKGIQDSLKNTISLGEQLNKSLNIAQPYRFPKIEPIVPSSNIDFGSLSKQIAKNKNKPVKEIAKHLDQLVVINSDSTRFMIEANKLQTRIAEEIKESSDSSTKLSKISILIGAVVLILTVLSFAYSIYSVRISNKSNNLNIERAIKELESINEAVKANNGNEEKFNDRLIILENQIDSLSSRNKELENKLNQMKIQTNKK
jgi:hypothetical protein